MAITYDTLGSTVTIIPTGTVAPGQLNTEVAIVGGYDSANAGTDVTAGEATVVNTSTEADNEFGANSELARQASLAFANGATAVHGVPLPETNVTETFAATTGGTLGNVPPMDPNVHPDHDITAQDTVAGSSVTVNIVYDDPPASPSDANTINLNPTTGDWEADESSDYDITYTYGDFSTSITNAAGQVVRMIAVCTESSGPKSTAQTELSSRATNFRFLRAVTGSRVGITETEASTYTPDTDDFRMIEVAPSRGTNGDSENVRTVGAIAGMAASQPVNVEGSITYDAVSGFDTYKVEYQPTTAEDFSRVTSITDASEVAQGVTTSSETTFTDIYAVEIIDLVVEGLHTRVKDYAGGSNAEPAQRRLKSNLKRFLSANSVPNAVPPLLASGDGTRPYSVTVSTGSVDTEADVDVGIDVAPIAKEVKLDISVGPVRFNGASV